MQQPWGVVVGLAAIVLLTARAAHADDRLLAQSSWPPPLQPPMQPPPIAGPRVTLQVDNPNGRLQQHMQFRWQDICIAPCGAVLDPRATYRVGGGTSIASEPFQLPRSSGEVFIDAQVGSKVKHWVGLGLMIGGAVAALYGLLYWQMSKAFDDFDSQSGSNSFGDTVRNIGLTVIGVGAVLEVVGIVMFSSGTSVEVH